MILFLAVVKKPYLVCLDPEDEMNDMMVPRFGSSGADSLVPRNGGTRQSLGRNREFAFQPVPSFSLARTFQTSVAQNQ